MKNIASAFVKAQKAFAPALKTNTNPHFKSRYVGLDGCIEAVIDALNSNGIALLQPTHEDATGVTVETLFLHESGEILSGGKLHVPASKQDPQGYGSALTYARRYSLMAACGIAPEDDDGNAASKPKPSVKMAALDGIGDSLTEETRFVLREWAKDAIAICREDSPQACIAFLKEKGMDDDERLYIDSQLPSDVRSAMRKVNK